MMPILSTTPHALRQLNSDEHQCGSSARSLPRLKLARCPRSLAPTLVTLPSMSLIPSAPLQAGHTANIFQDDSRVWAGVGYSRSVATGGSARVATGKRRGGAGADRIGQDLHLRAALSEPENSGGVHRPDPRTR